MKLPRGDSAIVDHEKLTGYCLNPQHPRGKHKARVFEAALGLTAENDKEGALAPDLAAYAGKTPGIPVLLRTIADRRLEEDELEELRDYIESHYSRGGDGSG